MDKLREYAKTVSGFVLAVLTNMAVNLQVTGTPIPQDLDGWLTLLITSAVVALGIALPRNKQTVKTIDTAIDKGDVTHAQVSRVAAKHEAPIPPLT